MIRLGDIVVIDLTDGTITREPVSGDLAATVLGGFGFNTWDLYHNLPASSDPLGPENRFVISCGLLTGTAAPASSRTHLSAASPLSGLMGSSNVGGHFGARLKSCGIASLIFKGRAPGPVFVHITADVIEIKDASFLWGLDTRETVHALQTSLEGQPETLTIGRAGENQVPFACVMHGHDHAAGRTGMGAVMGSKNLKAIAVQGTKVREEKKPEAAEAIRTYIRMIRESESRYHDFSTWGSSGDILELDRAGLLGTRNYRRGTLENVHRIDGRELAAQVSRKTSCHRCPVHCKAEIRIAEGRHQGFTGGRPEYETVINLGSLCGLSDPEELLFLSNLCNILGLDTISTGSVIAFAMELFDRRILTPEDTNGLVLDWGDARVMETLIRQIADRQGLGAILARGVKQAARIIGKDADKYAFHTKGVEIYGSDPRGVMGTALSYAVSLRGGDFTSVYPIPEYRYTPERAVKEFGTPAIVNPHSAEGKGLMVRKCLFVSAVIDSIGICKVPALSIIANFDLEMESTLVRRLTGLDLSASDLFRIGETIITWEKLFNLSRGAGAAQDTLPEKFLTEPLQDGPSRGAAITEMTRMVQDFYQCMGWDSQGIPKPETLSRLGISPMEPS